METSDTLLETYKLLLYLRIDGTLFLVDTVFGSDKNELRELGKGRKNNNEEYVAILSSYKLVNAEVL